jgi:cation transporter-like permease
MQSGSLLMSSIRLLALLPFLAILVGPFFVNRVTPYIFGMPFLLAWLVAWIVLTAASMAVIFRLDPENRDGTP